MRLSLIGLGATGSHIARQLSQSSFDELCLHDEVPDTQLKVTKSVKAIARDGLTVTGSDSPSADGADVVVLACPAGSHASMAKTALDAGSHVISLSDDPGEVQSLFGLGDLALRQNRTLTVGAGFAPGLSCILASFVAGRLDHVDVINTYRTGTAGPACARQHHHALKNRGSEWIEGNWVMRSGGSGRDLAWFPDPIGAKDCYRAALADPYVLQRSFPDAARITARMAATRRDRLTSRLPMLRPPHQDGGPGAIRVEVRGRVGGSVKTIIAGAMDHPSVAAAAVAAEVAGMVGAGQAPPGAGGLSAWPDPKAMLTKLRRRGVRVALYRGVLDSDSIGEVV